jgi:hypothetical protein
MGEGKVVNDQVDVKFVLHLYTVKQITGILHKACLMFALAAFCGGVVVAYVVLSLSFSYECFFLLAGGFYSFFNGMDRLALCDSVMMAHKSED